MAPTTNPMIAPPLAAVARRPGTWLLLLAAWALLAVASTTALLSRLPASGSRPSWWSAFGPQLLYWLPWVLIAPAVVVLAARMPLVRGRIVPGLAVHAAAGWTIGLVFQLYAFGVESALYGGGFSILEVLGAKVLRRAALTAHFGLGVYVLVLVIAEAWLGYRRLAAQSRALTEARLAALQAQLRPHFLFNALHGIAALTESDPRAARTMTAKLAALLRAVLDEPAGSRVPLAAELRTLDRYLEVEQLRFADRLRIERAIDDDTPDLLVPPLILQPLAENAVRHGIEQRIGAGRLGLRAYRDRRHLVVEIEDDGPGPAEPGGPDGRAGGGLGLANVRQRLDALYGDAASLTLEPVDGGGCRARLRLPIAGAEGP